MRLKLPVERLRWRCNQDWIDGISTEEIESIPDVIGQETAVDALRFGLETKAPGQNIFVRGLTGTGRMTLVQRILEEIRPSCPLANDRCYVCNLEQPDRPHLITLPRGQGKLLHKLMNDLADFIRDALQQSMNAEPIRARRNALEQSNRNATESLVEPFDAELRKAGLAIVTVNEGQTGHATIFPLAHGKPVPPEEFQQLVHQGKVPLSELERLEKERTRFQNQFEELQTEVHQIHREYQGSLRQFLQSEIRALLYDPVAQLVRQIDDEAVHQYVQDIVDDVAENRLHDLDAGIDFTRAYRVNLISTHDGIDSCPVIVENSPTVANLLGAIDREALNDEVAIADHLTIRAGSILRADGGFLILDARDILSEPGAWKMLSRTLRTGFLEIVPSETQVPWATGYTIKPEPIDINVKIILIGDGQVYHILDEIEYDFPHLFKVLADFDRHIPRDRHAAQRYAGVLARLVEEESLPPFDRRAIAILIEHGARIADHADKVTSQFGRLADLAREGAYLAAQSQSDTVSAEHIEEAIQRTRDRAVLPARRFREMVKNNIIRINTDGQAVGQINGLAVLQSGPLTYGFPARITSTIGPGSAGVINIEREASLSGAIHTKGFYILGGLLRTLLQTDHPLAFSASIAFEQSYGGIDGDSASGAEMCCLLSALTRFPIRQDLAMTGAIDQVGNILAIGAATAKIEGFFDVCNELGLTGTQGVIIPAANAGDLMLNERVVEACARGEFHVYAVETIQEAIEILTGRPAGAINDHFEYPEGSVLHVAKDRARIYWNQIRAAGTSAVAPAASNDDD